MMLVANSLELATPGSGISGYETIWFTMKKNDCRPSSDKPRLASDIPFTSMDKMVAYCLWTKAHWRYLLPKWLAIVWSVVKFISLNYVFLHWLYQMGVSVLVGDPPTMGFDIKMDQNGLIWMISGYPPILGNLPMTPDFQRNPRLINPYRAVLGASVSWLS